MKNDESTKLFAILILSVLLLAPIGTASAITNVKVQQSTDMENTTGTYSVVFTVGTTHLLSAIRVTFPAGFNTASASAVYSAAIGGTLATGTLSGQGTSVLTYTFSSLVQPGFGSTLGVIIGGIKSPAVTPASADTQSFPVTVSTLYLGVPVETATQANAIMIRQISGTEAPSYAAIATSANLLITSVTTSSYASIGGTLTVVGATTLDSTLHTIGATTLSSTLSVTGATTLSSTLHVVGATTLSSTLAVSGATTLSSTLHVVGATTLDSTLTVTGATTLSSTLAVTGATTLSSTLLVAGTTQLNNPLIFGVYSVLPSTSSYAEMYLAPGNALHVNDISGTTISLDITGTPRLSVSGSAITANQNFLPTSTAASLNIGSASQMWNNLYVTTLNAATISLSGNPATITASTVTAPLQLKTANNGAGASGGISLSTGTATTTLGSITFNPGGASELTVAPGGPVSVAHALAVGTTATVTGLINANGGIAIASGHSVFFGNGGSITFADVAGGTIGTTGNPAGHVYSNVVSSGTSDLLLQYEGAAASEVDVGTTSVIFGANILTLGDVFITTFTCTTCVSNADLAGSIANAKLTGPLVSSLTSTGSTISVTNPGGVGAANVDLNLGHSNTWTVTQTFNGATAIILGGSLTATGQTITGGTTSGTNLDGTYNIGGTPTLTVNLGATAGVNIGAAAAALGTLYANTVSSDNTPTNLVLERGTSASTSITIGSSTITIGSSITDIVGTAAATLLIRSAAGQIAFLKSGDNGAGSTGAAQVGSGTATGGSSGGANLFTGQGDVNSGNIFITTGPVTAAGTVGSVTVYTGSTGAAGTAGEIKFQIGGNAVETTVLELGNFAGCGNPCVRVAAGLGFATDNLASSTPVGKINLANDLIAAGPGAQSLGTAAHYFNTVYSNVVSFQGASPTIANNPSFSGGLSLATSQAIAFGNSGSITFGDTGVATIGAVGNAAASLFVNDIESGTGQMLVVKATGTSLNVWVNGGLRATLTNSFLSLSGGIGLSVGGGTFIVSSGGVVTEADNQAAAGLGVGVTLAAADVTEPGGTNGDNTITSFTTANAGTYTVGCGITTDATYNGAHTWCEVSYTSHGVAFSNIEFTGDVANNNKASDGAIAFHADSATTITVSIHTNGSAAGNAYASAYIQEVT